MAIVLSKKLEGKTLYIKDYELLREKIIESKKIRGKYSARLTDFYYFKNKKFKILEVNFIRGNLIYYISFSYKTSTYRLYPNRCTTNLIEEFFYLEGDYYYEEFDI